MPLFRPFCSSSIRPLFFPSFPIKSIKKASAFLQFSHSDRPHLPYLPRLNFCSAVMHADFDGRGNQLNQSPSLHVFEEKPKRKAILGSAHAFDLSRRYPVKGAFERFKFLLRHGLTLDRLSVSCFVRAIGEIASEEVKHEIHAVAVKTGLEAEISIATALIGFYASKCDMVKARCLFSEIPVKDLVVWSAMVSAYCKNHQFWEAIVTFSEMVSFGIALNSICLLSVLTACANLGALELGKQIHGFSIRRGFHSRTSLQNSLVDMYAECHHIDASILIFNGIREKDVIAWKNMIFGCIENGQLRKALSFFSDMRASHIQPDEVIIRNVIGVCSQVKEEMLGLGLHSYVIKNGFSSSTSVGTALLTMYAELKQVDTARALFDQLHDKDLVAWTALITAYSHTRHPFLAIEMFKQMQCAEVKANEITLVSLVRACSSMEAQEHGRSIHAHLLRLGYTSNLHATSSLIDFYCKTGRLNEGKALFDKFQSKDLVCWCSMINGYAINGQGEEAVQTFSNMLDHGMMPNEIAFVSLLSACSHCGMLDEGWRWFNSMEKNYGIHPNLLHYSCMVDMLSRQGKVEEALKFVKEMPMQPDESVWSALLCGCRITHADVKVAEIAAEQLFRLDPNNPSYYVMLSNMYSQLGEWGDAERIRQLINRNWLKKISAYSIV